MAIKFLGKAGKAGSTFSGTAGKKAAAKEGKQSKTLTKIFTDANLKPLPSRRGNVQNYKSSQTKSAYEKTLTSQGWKKATSKDGKVSIYEKNGDRIVTRHSSTSTGKPSADVTPKGSDKITHKIRFESE